MAAYLWTATAVAVAATACDGVGQGRAARATGGSSWVHPATVFIFWCVQHGPGAERRAAEQAGMRLSEEVSGRAGE